MKYGKDAGLLSEAERSTLVAMWQVGPHPNAIAGAQFIHVNTVKYRLACIRKKYGLAVELGWQWQVMRRALERGDVLLQTDKAVKGFALALGVDARDAFGVFGPTVESWLNRRVLEMLSERRAAA